MVPIATFATTLDFDDSLFVWWNSGMQDAYNHLSFEYGGNMFPGILFLKPAEVVSEVNIIFAAQTIASCTRKLAWAYYNPARGNRLWPLDQDTLTTLQSIDQSYDALTLNGWLYTDCNSDNPQSVYGHIQHIWEGTSFDIIAGTRMITEDNTYVTIPDHSLIIDMDDLSINGYIYDPLGWIAQVWSGPSTWPDPVCGNGIIEIWQQCDDGNLDDGDGCSSTCMIENGWVCNGEPSVCDLIDPNFNAWLQFPTLYTNTPAVNGFLYTTDTVDYVFVWDLISNYTGNISESNYVPLILSSWDGLKTIQTTFVHSTYQRQISGAAVIILDTTAPMITISQPTSGTIYSGTIPVVWNAEDNHGIAYSLIQVYQWNTLIYSYISTSNQHTIPALIDGEYTVTITVYDLANNSSAQSASFVVQNDEDVDRTPAITSFASITGAILNTTYTSNPLIITWLPVGETTNISLSTGMIIKNGLEAGTATTGQNGDDIRIQLTSSSTYNTTRTAELSIYNSIIPFSITTKAQHGVEENIPQVCANMNFYALIFAQLQTIYPNQDKFIMILQLLSSMVDDEIVYFANQWNTSAVYALQCFADIVSNYLMNVNTHSTNIHNQWIYVAPNGKEYQVEYIEEIGAYTSPDFMYHKVFYSYETFTRHIDINNPAQNSRNHVLDPSFSPVVHVAPNGKSYTIQKTNKWFMSYQFLVPAYFNTLAQTQAHIDRHNP